MNVFGEAPTKSDAPEPQIGRSTLVENFQAADIPNHLLTLYHSNVLATNSKRIGTYFHTCRKTF